MQDAVTIIVVQTTFPNIKAAEATTKTLLHEALVACAHLHSPVTSLYLWEGKLTEEQEIPVTYKVPVNKQEQLKERLLSLHSYDVPQYYSSQVDASEPYGTWVNLGKY